ncbi:agmatinase [Peribacillus frigoritolerans]|uniref:agmatinase n=1 Tax=Peribacillus frigoritolerans TaxID=450367 RepID=UPI0006C510AE|nr:agmatinase [Peribacillus frigoritolerans]KOR84329.1 agmatinase [Bacillus sp. FJAT-22058]AZV61208.1 agmatinase [Peribacillus frigoritolerans]MCY9136956.1 agmatinase [Peribacillus frigoritolerans]MDM5304837.1 agmatinase [Peribacillus frigoritolerans]UZD47747.1 agmatinase [Peribacillus frigoritolerans]
MMKYQPKDSFKSPRFCGVRTFMRLPFVEQIDEDMDFVITGIPFDSGQSFRTGARFGPEAIRDFSILLRPYNPEQDINIFDYISGIDYGDVPIIPGYISETYKKIEEELTPVIEKGIIPISLGGDHSITLGELRAIVKKHGPVALLQFDAHSDTWDSYFDQKYNHGTVFRRAIEEGLIDVSRSLQIGMRGGLYGPEDLQDARDLGLEVYTTNDYKRIGVEKMLRVIHERVANGPVFLSFDIDFLDPVYAPGTGTPEVSGASIDDALALVRGLTNIDFVGFDLVEVLPSYDHGQITAAAAANIVYEFITLIALAKKGKMEKKERVGDLETQLNN